LGIVMLRGLPPRITMQGRDKRWAATGPAAAQNTG